MVASWADPDRVNLAARGLPTFATWQAKPLHHPSDAIFAGTPTPADAIADLVEGRQNVARCPPHSASLQEDLENVLSTFLPDDAAIERDPGDDRPPDRRDRRGVSRGGHDRGGSSSVALSSIRRDFQTTLTNQWRREGWAQHTRASHLASHCGSSARRSGAD